MSDILGPVGFALFCWWFGTGIVFLAERAVRPRRALGMGLMLSMGTLALMGVARSAAAPDATGAYLGFASAIGLWGALELSFLTGSLTGPRSRACTPGCVGWRHFGHGIMALLYHELALLLALILVGMLCRGQGNPTAAWTLAMLWVMREGAKLNLFLGVRNPAAELLPRRLAHLAGYFGQRHIHPFLAVSIGLALVADCALLRQALAASVGSLQRTAGLLLTTLLALAILEYCLLILPVRADALWAWATRRGASAKAADAGAATSAGEVTKATAAADAAAGLAGAHDPRGGGAAARRTPPSAAASAPRLGIAPQASALAGGYVPECAGLDAAAGLSALVRRPALCSATFYICGDVGHKPTRAGSARGSSKVC